MNLCFRSDEPTGEQTNNKPVGQLMKRCLRLAREPVLPVGRADRGADEQQAGWLAEEALLAFSSRTLASGRTSRPGAGVIFSFVPRTGFRRTRTQSAAADGTRTRWLVELRHC